MSIAVMPTASIRFNRETLILLGRHDSAFCCSHQQTLQAKRSAVAGIEGGAT